jgi:alpha-galactosidase
VSANLPNQGQAPTLPLATIVEGPALVDGHGLRPLLQPPLSAALTGTLATRCQWVETIVEAALERSREKFVQALVLDGAVSSLDQAVALADELLAAQAPFLGW